LARTIVADLVADVAVGADVVLLLTAIKPEPVNSTVIEHVPEPEIVVQIFRVAPVAFCNAVWVSPAEFRAFA